MPTPIPSTLSDKNPYKLSVHRYLELKHFCLQYPEWKKLYLTTIGVTSRGETPGAHVEWSDPTGKCAIRRLDVADKIRIVEETTVETDPGLARYILIGVTENRGYPYLQMKLGIPCCKNYYYRDYRRFFWLLDRRLRGI